MILSRSRCSLFVPNLHCFHPVKAFRGRSFLSTEQPPKEAATAPDLAAEPATATSTPEVAVPEGTISHLRLQIEELKKEREDMKEFLLRYRADAENAHKVAQRDVENAKKFGVQRFAKQLLEVNDNLQRAIEYVPESAFDQETVPTKVLKDFFEGIKTTKKVMVKALESEGITEYDPMNEQFNPDLHDALYPIPYVENGPAPNTIQYVVCSGYTIHDRVLRVAKVGVVSSPPSPN